MNDLKTAKQNNAQQTGESEFKPNPPAALPKMPVTTEPTASRQTLANPERGIHSAPAGWSLRDLADTRENLREAVQAAAFVPPSAQAMIVEMIDQTFPKARLLRLDAHVHVFQRTGKPAVDVAMTIAEI